MAESLAQQHNAIMAEVNARETSIGGLHLGGLTGSLLAFPAHQILSKRHKYMTHTHMLTPTAMYVHTYIHTYIRMYIHTYTIHVGHTNQMHKRVAGGRITKALPSLHTYTQMAHIRTYTHHYGLASQTHLHN